MIETPAALDSEMSRSSLGHPIRPIGPTDISPGIPLPARTDLGDSMFTRPVPVTQHIGSYDKLRAIKACARYTATPYWYYIGGQWINKNGSQRASRRDARRLQASLASITRHRTAFTWVTRQAWGLVTDECPLRARNAPGAMRRTNTVSLAATLISTWCIRFRYYHRFVIRSVETSR